MEDLIVSVPGLSYDAIILEQQRQQQQWQQQRRRRFSFDTADAAGGEPTTVPFTAAYTTTSSSRNGGTTVQQRHSLLLVPQMEITLGCQWRMKHPQVRQSYEHHSPYLSYPPQYQNDCMNDKFYLFGSHGVDLTLSVTLSSSELFASWMALRIDVLPWITHTNPSLRDGFVPPPPVEGSPGPLPQIQRLMVDAKVMELNVATWYNESYDISNKDAYEDESKTNESASAAVTAGLCLVVPSVSVTLNNNNNGAAAASQKRQETKVHMVGPVQAALIDNRSLSSTMSTQINNSYSSRYSVEEEDDAMELYDRMTGLYGTSKLVATEAVKSEQKKRRKLKRKRSHTLRLQKELSRKGGKIYSLIESKSSTSSSPSSSSRGGGGGGVEGSNNDNMRNLFSLLQHLKHQITEMEYLVVIEHIDILDRSLEELTSSSSLSSQSQNNERDTTSSSTQSPDGTLPPANNNAESSPPSSDSDDSTWTVMVSGMKLLWTIEIRDSITSIVSDLIHTVNFMRVQSRTGQTSASLATGASPQMQGREGAKEGGDSHGSSSDIHSPVAVSVTATTSNPKIFHDTTMITGGSDGGGEAVIAESFEMVASLRDTTTTSQSNKGSVTAEKKKRGGGGGEVRSSLSYLLQTQNDKTLGGGMDRERDSAGESSDDGLGGGVVGLDKPTALASTVSSDSRSGNTLVPITEEADTNLPWENRNEGTSTSSQANRCYNETAPTFDVHLSNPQIQLHSETTGGSVVVAMRGAYVEGRKFVHLFTTADAASAATDAGVSLDSLLRKTEFLYTLDRVNMFAMSNDVDVSAGLQWVEVTKVPEQKGTNVHWKQHSSDQPTGNVARQTTGGSNAMEDLFLSDDVRNDDDLMEGPSDPPSRGGAVSAHAVPSCNESQQQHTFPAELRQHESLNFATPNLLKKILHQCTFTTRQRFHRPPTDLSREELLHLIEQQSVLPLSGGEGIDDGMESGVGVQNSKMTGTMLDKLELEIDELSFVLDSYQFSTTIDVIRNVLLEPVKPPRPRQLQQVIPSQEKEDHDISSIGNVSQSENDKAHDDQQTPHAKSAQANKVNDLLTQWHADDMKQQRGKRGRDSLRLAAKELQEELEEQHLSGNGGERTVRLIDYTLGKLKWKVSSPEYLDDVEINFTDFHGVHEFSEDGTVRTQFELEDIHISTHRPGPSSMHFADPTVILTTAIGAERSPCQRCGERFDRTSNESYSCVFHADKYGRPGRFRNGIWSCCKSTVEKSPGCTSRPHTGMEQAAIVRIESLPRAVEGITLYRHLEVNVYPSVPHTIIVQMTRNLSSLFLAYFMGERIDDANASGRGGDSGTSRTSSPQRLKRGERGSPTRQQSKGLNVDSGDDSLKAGSGHSLPPGANRSQLGREKGNNQPKKKAVLLGTPSTSKKNPSESTSGRIPDGTPHSLSDAAANPKNKFDSSGDSRNDENEQQSHQQQQDEEEPPRREVFFIKFWRVGYINVDVSLADFPVLPEKVNVGIVVPAFSKAYKVGTPNYLGHKFLSHLVHEVVKSVASSTFGLTRRQPTPYELTSAATPGSPKNSTGAKANSSSGGTSEMDDSSSSDHRSLSSSDSIAASRGAELLLGIPLAKKVKPKKKMKRLLNKSSKK